MSATNYSNFKNINNNVNYYDLKKKIDSLSEVQQQEIFKIIIKNNEKYTTNTNGVFVNITLFKSATIQEILSYLDFCQNSAKFLTNLDEDRTNYAHSLSS